MPFLADHGLLATHLCCEKYVLLEYKLLFLGASNVATVTRLPSAWFVYGLGNEVDGSK